MASPSAETVEAGTLVRMRLLGLQGRTADALALFTDFGRRFPQAVPGPSLVTEAWRLRRASGKAADDLVSLLTKREGPGAWVLQGGWRRLPGPAEAWGLTFQETVRLQVGAFQDWGHALTLIDMLREKGWVPFVDLKTTAAGDRLHLVYIVSRQPDSDRERLGAQGLLTLP